MPSEILSKLVNTEYAEETSFLMRIMYRGRIGVEEILALNDLIYYIKCERPTKFMRHVFGESSFPLSLDLYEHNSVKGRRKL